MDIVGDSETLGKPAGSDIRQGKSTYVSLLGLDGAGHQLHAQILKAQAAIKPLGERASFLNELAFYIEERKH